MRAGHCSWWRGAGLGCSYGSTRKWVLCAVHLRKSGVRQRISAHYILLPSKRFACFTSPAPPVSRVATCLPHTRDLPHPGRPHRYFILFPIRALILMIGFNSLVASFLVVDIVMPKSKSKMAVQRKLVQWMCCAWVCAWHGVIRCGRGATLGRGTRGAHVQWYSMEALPLVKVLPPERLAAPSREVLTPCGRGSWVPPTSVPLRGLDAVDGTMAMMSRVQHGAHS